MPNYTTEEYAALLTRTFTPRCPRDNRPRCVTDVTDKGAEVLEFILPHPEEGRFSVSVRATVAKGYVTDCALYFGQAEVASALDPEEVPAAIEEILSDRIIAIVRYKNRDAYESHRKSSNAPSEWLYQLPDDEEILEAMQARLSRPATLPERLSGKYIGVFETYRWSGSTLTERK